jgi:hypothetical protein
MKIREIILLLLIGIPFTVSFLFGNGKVGVFFLVIGIIYQFYVSSKEFEENKIDIFTSAECKVISYITAIREGSFRLNLVTKTYCVFDYLSFDKENQLHVSIVNNLKSNQQFVNLNSNGEIVDSPWIMTRDLYWKNREKAKLTI